MLKISSLNLQKMTSRRFFSNRELFVYDPGHAGMRNSISGIRATIFGATGFTGKFVGAALGYISSDLVFPTTRTYRMDDQVKYLKLCANLGQSFIVREMNFKNPKMIERVISTSNVVINLVGPKNRYTDKADFEWTNIEIPRRIARACKNNPNIKRLIHMSACGAEENSSVLDFSTKWRGEQAVMEQFPAATIFRPTTVYGRLDNFVNNFRRKVLWVGNGIIIFDDCMAKRQPLHVYDLSQCVLNALKMSETAGKTYELGGPTTYTRKECYEVMFNVMQKKPGLFYFSRDLAELAAKHTINHNMFNTTELQKDLVDIFVSDNARKIDELCVNPVSFYHGVEKLLIKEAEPVAGDKELDER